VWIQPGEHLLYDIKAAASPPRAGCGRLASLAVLAGHQAEHQLELAAERLGEQLRRRAGACLSR